MERREDNLVETLRGLGYRLTPQRMMILSAVQARDDHFRAEDIHAAVTERYPQVNLSTIYRTLELLANLGLVTSTDLGEGCVRYHPAPKGRHHHLVCQRCGHIQELDEAVLQPLAESLQSRFGFQANLGHLAIFGCCAACQQAGCNAPAGRVAAPAQDL